MFCGLESEKWLQLRPEYGLDCLTCAEFTRQRSANERFADLEDVGIRSEAVWWTSLCSESVSRNLRALLRVFAGNPCHETYLTESVYEVVWQKSIPAQIRQHVLCIRNCQG